MNAKLKIILCIIAAIGSFILGLFAAGRHNRSGITDAIDREGELQDGITDAQDGEREHKNGIADLESRIDNQGERINKAENRIRDTNSLVDELKKRNGLE